MKSDLPKSIHFVIITIALILYTTAQLAAAGKVYLVLGSDTAIWNGMDVARYNCYYSPLLYTDPSANAYGVMDPTYRNAMTDSYGTPMKLTWWMMCGSIFGPGSNTNVPFPNVMTMYLMKKYHGERVQQFGDELSLHYHTFQWNDYDNDGKFWWNQTYTFEESREDYEFTLAQLLIEEDIFPVSFRSGWHFMDNGWQHHLDDWVPYSMHNDWPNDRIDTEEPLDNTFHWADAPGQFVPYRPSPENYQLPGDGPGWNVRSTHLNTARYRDLIDSIFTRAANGQDQLACIWGHLPETDFLSNLQIIDSLAHRFSNQTGVSFRYCTAIEAMQRWRETSDSLPPVLTFDAVESGDDVYFQITTDEPIFQKYPFVAVKTIYEQYQLIPCNSSGANSWQTATPVSKQFLARAAVAVCDTLGNQSLDFIDFRPADTFVDNEDAGYSEISGNWSSVSGDFWGVDHRMAGISTGDSAIAEWQFSPAADGMFNIEIRMPNVANPANQLTFYLTENGSAIDTISTDAPTANAWHYITTANLATGSTVSLKMVAKTNLANANVAADVVKFSALVRDRDLHPASAVLDFGEVIIDDSTFADLALTNRGIEPLTISGITSANGFSGVQQQFPLTIPGRGTVNISAFVVPATIGDLRDTLRIASDDPVKPQLEIPLSAKVQHYFVIIDNEDAQAYSETGTWATSNAQAYGSSSRYAPLGQNPGAVATFTVNVEKSSYYDLFEIVPTTVNAADHALYQVYLNGFLVDAFNVDQNDGSGNWVKLARYHFPENATVEVRVIDDGGSTPGLVLRADAIKFAIPDDATAIAEPGNGSLPETFEFEQNYPNPFNATTRFRYALPQQSRVELHIFNAIGQQVATLIDEPQTAGNYEFSWDANAFASGIYFARLKAGNQVKTQKMILLK